MANEIAAAGDVVATPAEETAPVARDAAGRFAAEEPAEPAAEQSALATDDHELLEARVRTAQVREEAARIGLLPLGDDLPIDDWARPPRFQNQSVAHTLSP